MALTRGHRPLPAATALPTALLPTLLLCLLAAPGCDREKAPKMETPPAGIIQEVSPGQSVTTDVNARAPAFARETMGGETVRTQDFIGRQVVLLDFWSVFCQSCLEEIPFLQQLYRDYHDQGLEIISINTDFFPSARIAGFMKKTGIDLPFPLVLDRDQSLSKLFKVEALPVTVLIDSSGWIRMVHLGYGPSDEKMIEKRVRKACDRIKETIVTLQPVEGRTAFSPPDAGGESLLEAGASAPDFHAADPEGRETSFSELRGDSPAVVFFWSLFCQPCREEFPVLVDLARTYAPRGLKTFAVNLDTEKLFPAAAAFARKNGGNLTALFEDAAGGESGGAASFGVRYTPSTFLLAGDGTISYSSSGEFPSEDLKREIDLLLSTSPRESD